MKVTNQPVIARSVFCDEAIPSSGLEIASPLSGLAMTEVELMQVRRV